MSKKKFEDLTYAERGQYAQRIKSLRQAADVTQEALGASIGASRQTINNWETGKSVPQSDKLEAVYRELGANNDDPQFQEQTEIWLGLMGTLIETIPARRRPDTVNRAIKVLADGVRDDVGGARQDDYDTAASPTDPDRGEDTDY